MVQAYSEVIRALHTDGQVLVGEGRRPYRIASIRSHRAGYLLYLQGLTDRDAAERLRDSELQLRMEDAEPLPEGVFYHWQILGLQVVGEDGRKLGEIAEILETGANDVYIVRSPEGGELLLPALRSVVLHVDETAGTMQVRLPPGLVDPA